MLTEQCASELRSSWLPNISDCGLDHLINLLEKGSPLLIHGSFTRAVPMGCLATQIAWRHPKTEHLTLDAGVAWLNQVAGLNPASSHVIREWDGCRFSSWEFRQELLAILREHRRQRQSNNPQPATNRVAELIGS